MAKNYYIQGDPSRHNGMRAMMTDWLFLLALIIIAIKVQDNSNRIDKIEKELKKGGVADK